MAIWPVWLSSRDFRHYHPSFFTTRDVAAGKELTFEYRPFDAEHASSALKEMIFCCCGTESCQHDLLFCADQ